MSEFAGALDIPIKIRLAALEDESAMKRVEAESRAQLVDNGIAVNQIHLNGFVEDTSWDLAFVAETPTGIVGFVRASADGSTLIADQLSVAPSWGRRGIGMSLLERLAREAKTRGFERILGTTFRDVVFNAPWYQRLGGSIMADHALALRRHVEQSVGLDVLGPRVVISFDLRTFEP